MDNFSMGEIPQEKMRFVESGEGLDVTYPQCVGCKFNIGSRACGALAEKPSEYLSNEEKCPMRKKPHEEE